MTIAVRRFQLDDAPALDRLNGRLAAAGLPHRVGREQREQTLDAEPIVQRLYVAAGDDEIRGGVWLKEQLFWSEGRPLRVGWAIYPVAESLIDGRSAGVPASLIFSLLREQPHLMALGMGGHGGPFAKVLGAARWASSLLPFFFHLVRPARVLRRLSYARATRLRRLVSDGLAYTGLAWIANAVVTAARGARRRAPAGYTAALVDRFDAWADTLWERCRDAYGFIARRDSAALNALYPAGFRSLSRVRVRRGERDIGWICTRSIDARGTWFERHFGDLRLGIVTDALAHPTDADAVMDAGFRHLTSEGVDLIVTYQSHPAWCAAARRVGMLPGPSNCAFARSPAVDAILVRSVASGRGYHLTASDGDGPEPV